MDDGISLNAWVSVEMKESLRELADIQNVTISALVERLLRQAMHFEGLRDYRYVGWSNGLIDFDLVDLDNRRLVLRHMCGYTVALGGVSERSLANATVTAMMARDRHVCEEWRVMG